MIFSKIDFQQNVGSTWFYRFAVLNRLYKFKTQNHSSYLQCGQCLLKKKQKQNLLYNNCTLYVSRRQSSRGLADSWWSASNNDAKMLPGT